MVTCGICLEENIREIGELDSCYHRFCFPCIWQWSKTENKCPFCKTRFICLTNKKLDQETAECDDGPLQALAGEVLGRHMIADRQQGYMPEEDLLSAFLENLRCHVCGGQQDAEQLLICDGCSHGYHTYCVGLEDIPADDWFCPTCLPRRSRQIGRGTQAPRTPQQAVPRSRSRARPTEINLLDSEVEEEEEEEEEWTMETEDEDVDVAGEQEDFEEDFGEPQNDGGASRVVGRGRRAVRGATQGRTRRTRRSASRAVGRGRGRVHAARAAAATRRQRNRQIAADLGMGRSAAPSLTALRSSSTPSLVPHRLIQELPSDLGTPSEDVEDEVVAHPAITASQAVRRAEFSSSVSRLISRESEGPRRSVQLLPLRVDPVYSRPPTEPERPVSHRYQDQQVVAGLRDNWEELRRGEGGRFGVTLDTPRYIRRQGGGTASSSSRATGDTTNQPYVSAGRARLVERLRRHVNGSDTRGGSSGGATVAVNPGARQRLVQILREREQRNGAAQPSSLTNSASGMARRLPGRGRTSGLATSRSTPAAGRGTRRIEPRASAAHVSTSQNTGPGQAVSEEEEMRVFEAAWSQLQQIHSQRAHRSNSHQRQRRTSSSGNTSLQDQTPLVPSQSQRYIQGLVGGERGTRQTERSQPPGTRGQLIGIPSRSQDDIHGQMAPSDAPEQTRARKAARRETSVNGHNPSQSVAGLTLATGISVQSLPCSQQQVPTITRPWRENRYRSGAEARDGDNRSETYESLGAQVPGERATCSAVPEWRQHKQQTTLVGSKRHAFDREEGPAALQSFDREEGPATLLSAKRSRELNDPNNISSIRPASKWSSSCTELSVRQGDQMPRLPTADRGLSPTIKQMDTSLGDASTAYIKGCSPPDPASCLPEECPGDTLSQPTSSLHNQRVQSETLKHYISSSTPASDHSTPKPSHREASGSELAGARAKNYVCMRDLGHGHVPEASCLKVAGAERLFPGYEATISGAVVDRPDSPDAPDCRVGPAAGPTSSQQGAYQCPDGLASISQPSNLQVEVGLRASSPVPSNDLNGDVDLCMKGLQGERPPRQVRAQSLCPPAVPQQPRGPDVGFPCGGGEQDVIAPVNAEYRDALHSDLPSLLGPSAIDEVPGHSKQGYEDVHPPDLASSGVDRQLPPSSGEEVGRTRLCHGGVMCPLGEGMGVYRPDTSGDYHPGKKSDPPAPGSVSPGQNAGLGEDGQHLNSEMDNVDKLDSRCERVSCHQGGGHAAGCSTRAHWSHQALKEAKDKAGACVKAYLKCRPGRLAKEVHKSVARTCTHILYGLVKGGQMELHQLDDEDHAIKEVIEAELAKHKSTS